MALRADEITDLYDLANAKGLVLLEALKTAFAPGFQRMVAIARGGTIGSIRSVDATFTKLIRTGREVDSPVGGAITELAVRLLSPAAPGVVLSDRTGVVAPRRDHTPVGGAHRRRDHPVGGGAVSELAVVVVTPAPQPVVGLDPARSVVGESDGSPRAGADRGGDPALARGAVADLADVAAAPAPELSLIHI